MSETETTEAAPAVSAETEDRIVDRVVDRLKDILKGGHAKQGSETEPDEPASMAAEVRREVERLREAETRQHREEELTADVGDLKQKVAAIPERQPREYRRSTRIMKWATEDDR